jgi:UDP-2-acetamido-3-amino-2,3-dideoxy-glucuronate N-acetyltransferase
MDKTIFIHNLSDVKTKNIGKKTRIWQYCTILENAVIGENCNINCNVFIENDVVIGNNATIKIGVQIWDGITIEDNVFIGPNVTFTNDLIPRSKIYPDKFERTLIKENASIGANSTVLPGIMIGEFSLIGAGSVITKHVPPFTVWYGNPAKHKGYITRNNIVLSLNLKDKKGNNYILNNSEPVLKND